MKKYLLPTLKLASILVLMFTVNLSFAQILETPRVSPMAKMSTKIGMTWVTVKYSRPQVIVNGNDRTDKIWGQQVQYGFNKITFAGQGEIPWRAGANENTIIHFSKDVKVEGKDLPAGKYGLHMAVFEDGKVTVIFSENTTSWGSFYYDESEDALRVDVMSKEHPFTNVLTYDFVELGQNQGVLALNWEKKQIPIQIETNTIEDALASIEDELRGQIGFGWQGPLQAANFCYQNNTHHKKGMAWIDRSISNNKNFQNLFVKSGLLLQMEKKSEAMTIADEAAGMASKNQLNFLGYTMMNNEEKDKAVEFFKMNLKNNPDDPNMYDSLGEGYRAIGDDKNAIKMFKKSLSMNPPPNVKANSEKNLKEMGVEIIG